MEEAGLKETEDFVIFNQNVISDDEGSDGEEAIKSGRKHESGTC